MENRNISIPLFAVCGVLLVVVCVSIFGNVTGDIQDRLTRQQADFDRQSTIEPTAGGVDRKQRDSGVVSHVVQNDRLNRRLIEQTEKLNRLTAEYNALKAELENSQTLVAELLAQVVRSGSPPRSAVGNTDRNTTSTAPVKQPRPAGTETSSETEQPSEADRTAAERERLNAELERIQDELERELAVMLAERRVLQNALSGALIDTGAAAVPALVDLLMSDRVEVRVWAAYVLGEIGPPAASAVPALRDALSDSDEDVRAQAAQALEAVNAGGGD